MANLSLHLKPVPPFRLDLTLWVLRRRPHNQMHLHQIKVTVETKSGRPGTAAPSNLKWLGKMRIVRIRQFVALGLSRRRLEG